jgi:hypothetical protein
LSQIANVIVAASAGFVELVGVGDEAIDRITLNPKHEVVGSTHPTKLLFAVIHRTIEGRGDLGQPVSGIIGVVETIEIGRAFGMGELYQVVDR